MKKSGQIPKHLVSLLSQYQIIKKVGSGLTAEVYEAQHSERGRVSIKVISPGFYSSRTGRQLIENQIKILKQIKHKNILQFFQVVQKGEQMCIVTNFCEGGDLQAILNKNKGLPESKALQYVLKIVEGCIHLRECGIVHRDIKPSNIFITKSEPVIADFGFSVLDGDSKLMNLNAGSPLYMSHESLTNRQFSEKSDVFAFGATFYQILTNKTPWSASSEKQLAQKIRKTPKLPQNISENIRKLILKCLAFNAKDRPNFTQVLEQVKIIIQKRKETSPKPLAQRNIQITQKDRHLKSFSFTLTPTYKKVNQNKANKQNKQNSFSKVSPSSKIKQRPTTVRMCIKQVEEGRQKMTLSDLKQSNFLQLINPSEFTFLPSSLILKFKYIVQQYKKVLGIENSSCKQFCSSSQNDKLITEIQNCSTELQLCRTIQAFVRRLFRLTKNYKEYPNCLNSLQSLYNRVNAIMV